MLVLISVVDYKFMTLFELWFMDRIVSNPSNFILYHAPFLLLFVDFKIFYDSCPCRCTVGKIIKDVMLFRIKLSFKSVFQLYWEYQVKSIITHQLFRCV